MINELERCLTQNRIRQLLTWKLETFAQLRRLYRRATSRLKAPTPEDTPSVPETHLPEEVSGHSPGKQRSVVDAPTSDKVSNKHS